MIRKLILFSLASALLIAGAYLIHVSLVHPSFYSIVRGVGIGLFLTGLGGCVAWEDFIKPYFSNAKK